MTRGTKGLVLASVILMMGLAGVLGININSVERRAEAQIVNIDGIRRIIGDEPKALGADVYRLRVRWVPRSLAVYRDGKRCSRKTDYLVDIRARTITFNKSTNPSTVVIVDYEPR